MSCYTVIATVRDLFARFMINVCVVSAECEREREGEERVCVCGGGGGSVDTKGAC